MLKFQALKAFEYPDKKLISVIVNSIPDMFIKCLMKNGCSTYSYGPNIPNSTADDCIVKMLL